MIPPVLILPLLTGMQNKGLQLSSLTYFNYFRCYRIFIRENFASHFISPCFSEFCTCVDNNSRIINPCNKNNHECRCTIDSSYIRNSDVKGYSPLPYHNNSVVTTAPIKTSLLFIFASGRTLKINTKIITVTPMFNTCPTTFTINPATSG